MKKFLLGALAILVILFLVDTFVLKDEGVVNKVMLDGKYKKHENAQDLPIGLEKEHRAPDFSLTDLAGNQVKLSDYKGKKVLVNFWATWCPPCKAEMPYMQTLYEKYKGEGFEILAVNATTSEVKRENVQKFIDEYKLTFTIPMDEKGEVASQYEIMAYPTSFFIDTDGVIRSKMVGAMSEEFIETEIKKLP